MRPGLILGAWALVMLGVSPARGEVIGYRIEAKACAGARCVILRTPRDVWAGKYACDARTSAVAEEAEDILKLGTPLGLPSLWEVTARCVPVDGMPDA